MLYKIMLIDPTGNNSIPRRRKSPPARSKPGWPAPWPSSTVAF